MNNLACISVTAAAETVIKKLSRANIAFYSLRTRGACTTFCVRDKRVKKVFAIFSHPCYNISVVKYGAVRSLRARIISRAGLAVGLVLFAAAVVISQSFVFRVQVTGSGAHLAPEIRAILREYGVQAGSVYRLRDKPLTISRIMALPSVTFCSIERRGTAVVVDVECSREDRPAVVRTPLLAPVSGRVENIVAVCGTPLVSRGQEVENGRELIAPYAVGADGKTSQCLCVGYADILVSASLSTCAVAEGDEGLKDALAAVRLYSDSAQVSSWSARAASGGVIYTVNFTYICTVSVNMQ